MIISKQYKIRDRMACSLVVFLSVVGCSSAPTKGLVSEFSGPVFGSTYSIKVIASDQTPLTTSQEETIHNALATCFDDINKTLSTYQDDSELARFNHSDSVEPQPASTELVALLDSAQQVSRQSNGAFDITVAPLVHAWGFGGASEPSEPPSDEKLAELRNCVGYDLIEIDKNAGMIRKNQPCVTCDVNAIAPGYAVDRVATILDELGYHRYMIEIGGEVRTFGTNAEGHPWRIGIERPLSYTREVQRIVELKDCSISTSGDYRNYYEKDGVRISHTIDPRTAKPITHTLASVTVAYPSCTLADAYATTLMVLGPDEGMNFAERFSLPVLFIVRTSPDVFSEKTSSAWREQFSGIN